MGIELGPNSAQIVVSSKKTLKKGKKMVEGIENENYQRFQIEKKRKNVNGEYIEAFSLVFSGKNTKTISVGCVVEYSFS